MKKILSFLSSPTSNIQTDGQDTLIKKTIYWLLSFTIIITGLLLFLLQCNKLTGAVTFLVVAGASAAGGAALGFLFGLPRAEKYRFVNKDDADHNAKAYSYGDNTNLEEVSDWLTKIIVGITLIKLRTIIGWIDMSARSIENIFKADCGKLPYLHAYVFGYAAIILYFLAGAGLCYLWARTNLSLILTKARIAQLQLEKQQLITQVQALANPKMDNTATEVPVDHTEEPKNIALIKEVPSADFRNLIERIYHAKPIFDKTDLQKGRWGGKSEVGDKVLEAIYDPGTSFMGLYRIKLRVRILNTENSSNKKVAFFLHDSFPSEIVYTTTDNNMAEIKVTAWQAFVVGARLEDGTELELDLNTVKGFPEGFYWS